MELRMLYGMAEPLQAAVVDAGYRLRVYAPVGDLIPGMAYLVRRLLENTANESILRRQFLGNQSLDELLKSPAIDKAPPSLPLEEVSTGGGGSEPEFTSEPHTDFSRAEARERMRAALATVRTTLGRRIELAFPPPKGLTRPTLTARNPARPEEMVGVVSAAVPEDVDAAVARAVAGGRAWAATPAPDRVVVLAEAADLLRPRPVELAALEVFEVGKGWRDADADVAEAIDFLEYYRRQMRRLAEPIRLGTLPGELNHLLYRPRGVVAVLSPWNFPLAIPTGMVGAALVTGNAVVFKPSERAPVTGHALVEGFREAGLPDGVLQFLPREPEAGRRLVAPPHAPLIPLTGSKAVGLQIIAAAAQGPPGQREGKKGVAGMGGKNAIIG